MDRNRCALISAVAMLAFCLGCTSYTAQPLGPSGQVNTGSAATAVAPLKVTAPTVQSPINDQRTGTLASTPLVATAATGQFASVALQYRFQVFNDTGASVQDSGLVNSPTWTMALTLVPLTRYSWRVRAEYQGTPGPWSALASFITPEQPPAYNKPIGNWQICGSRTKKEDLVVCVWNAVLPTDAVGDFEVTKRVAWLLRFEGAGLLIKDSGENIIRWQGYSFSASRICYPNGTINKLMLDVGPGGSNAPIFGADDTVDPSFYVPAIDPARP